MIEVRACSVAVLAGAAALSGCAHFPAAGLLSVGAFLDQDGRPLTDAQLGARLKGAAFVLVGEAHDNLCDHAAEARVARVMGANGPFALGLEMVTFDQQPVLDRYDAGDLDLRTLPAALDWKTTWGFDFDAYAPIFQAARTARAPVVGLNAPARWVHEVRDKGLEGLPLAERLSVTPLLLPPPSAQEEMLRTAFDEHLRAGRTSGPPEGAWQRFLRVQSFWDSEMAWRAARAAEVLHVPVLVLAGVGHVEHGWGIASRLRVFARGAAVTAITPWRGDRSEGLGDALHYLCPDGANAGAALGR